MGGDTSPSSLQEKVAFYRAKIKEWEGEYLAANGIRPDKEALGSAPDDVKTAYKSYYRSRKQLEKAGTTQSKENSFEKENIEVDNNIIGNTENVPDKKCELESANEPKEIQDTSNFVKLESNKIDEVDKNIKENEGVWGLNFNKNKESQNKKSFNFNSDSLYSKMAEKMRDVGTVKVRTSLKKRSSIGSTQRLNLLKKTSNSPALSRSFSSPVGSSSYLSSDTFSDMSESVDEPSEMFADESETINESGLNEHKDLEITGPKNSIFNVIEKDDSLQSIQSQKKSIFETIESQGEVELLQNESPDTNKSRIPFKVNKRNPFNLKSQAQVVSAVSQCSKGNDLNLLFTKNKNVDRAWLARTTNDLVGEKLESGPIAPAKDWKMKLVEKEYNESECLEDMDTEDGIKLNVEHNEQKTALPSKLTSNKKGKQKLKSEADSYKNKQTNKRNSEIHHEEDEVIENEPGMDENNVAIENNSNNYQHEISSKTNTAEIDDCIEKSISLPESSKGYIENIRKERKSSLPYVPNEVIKTKVPASEKRSSKRNTVRKNLKESDSEDDSWHHQKEINETLPGSETHKRKRIVLHEPLSDEESEEEWKPTKADKDELVNESEEEIQEGSHEWEENASASRSKKRKAQTLEELEEDGVIQSSWPAPKKRRTTLNAKKGRKALMWKAEHVAHTIEAASPKTNKTRGRKKKGTNIESQMEIKKKIQAKRKTSKASSHKLPENNIEPKPVKSLNRTNNINQVGSNQNPSEKTSLPPSTMKSSETAGEYNEQDDIDRHGTKTSISNKKMISKEERFAKKIASGTVNQNYLKINLKKKTFVRGKKTMTGGKYRRAEWKRKQMEKSAEQGNEVAVKKLTCFKCGDFGHWSKYCPGKSDKLMGIEQYDENESTFLSLEEASNMALGIKSSASDAKTNVYSSGANHAWFGGPKESHDSNHGQFSQPSTQASALPLSDQNQKSEGLDGGSVKNNENKELMNSDDDDLFDDENMEIGNDPSNVEEEIPDDILQQMEDDAYAANETSTQSSYVPSLNIASSQNYYEPRPTVEPLYPLLENGEVQPTTDEVKETLAMFGYSSFREGQENAIMRILSGQSTLLILSTGSGKSLCYQLPAYIYAKHNNCITLCVSPLVSLMEDQVTGLPHFLNAVCLHHHQSPTVRSKALTALQSGNAHILLVSPEAVVASRSGGVLGTLLKELPPIAFACLDEAHCVSEWSHNFRPSYLRVCQVMREKLGVKTILGLTATARHTTAISIARHLQVSDQEAGGVIRGTGVRENLLLSISRDEQREQALLELLQGDRFVNCSSIIIYCTRRDLCEKIATLIRSQLLDASKVDVKSNLKRTRGVSFDAEAYHAGLSGSRRGTIQKRFMSGKLRIVVATVAFGMGIDKPDLRGVIHFNMPKNVESYVQEIGRAGRDGKIAHCHLFLDFHDGQDQQELKRHIFANSIDRHTVRKLLNKIFKPCACAKIRNLETSQKSNPSTPTKHNSKLCNESGVSTNNMDSESKEGNDSMDDDSEKIPTKEVNASAPGLEKTSIAPSSCPRHEVAIEIEKMIEELDLPEENLQTLLCYLELQPGALVQLKHHVYSTATVSCYGGPKQLCAVSRRCPPLAVALALQRQEGKHHDNTNTAVFNVIEVSAKMGWNSGVVKRELKNLEWNNGKRSGVNVEFSDLAFNMFVRGDLNEDEQDQLLDDLYERAMTQERDQLRQLQYTYQTLRAVSHNTILLCCDEVDMERCIKLRNELIDYFSEGGGKLSNVVLEEKVYIRPELEMGVRSSVRSIITTHADMPWTGRAVARVFHGIGSPNFPVETWGRVRRFWRSHLNIDFKIVVKLATQEIIRCRV